MRQLITLSAALLLATVAFGADAPAAGGQGPGELVQGVAEAMLKDLDANRAEYKKDPSKINALVEKHLVPNFDSEYSARLVLGRHWRDASEAQRKRFVDAFYKSLLNNYGTALADFTGDKLKVLPTKVEADAKTATVRTVVKRSNGQNVPVNYTMRKTDGGWKAWDVVIEGISYVKSFREDFGAEIDQKGLDAVIDRMEKGGKPIAASNKKT
jgi:phospholipid transport system substrate-binding protein